MALQQYFQGQQLSDNNTNNFLSRVNEEEIVKTNYVDCLKNFGI